MTIDELIEQLQELKRACPGATIAPVHVTTRAWCECCYGEGVESHRVDTNGWVDRVAYSGGAVNIESGENA